MQKYQLENDIVLIEFLDLGGCITKMINKKTQTNYVLQYAEEKLYHENPYFFGATIGRNAGRTYPPAYQNSSGEQVLLDQNEGDVHLHGGKAGLQYQVWIVEKLTDTAFRLRFEDTNSSYEAFQLQLDYRLSGADFTIEMTGHGTQPTICNLTNHSYFNLNQQKTQTIENHTLKVAPAKIQVIDSQFVPTGEYLGPEVSLGAAFSFEQPRQIATALNQTNELAEICAGGIDLAYCFTGRGTPQILLTSEDEQNHLAITSDQEACVIYTLNKIDQSVSVNDYQPIQKYQGITFEMQRKPNYIHEAEDYLVKDYQAVTNYQIF